MAGKAGLPRSSPLRPDFVGDPLAVIHRQINRGALRVVGPPIEFAISFFGNSSEETIPLRSTIAPGEEVAGERQS
jgi:hypothetical protein